jgi:hypothetical protein
VISFLSLRLLWRSRNSADTFGRRALFPHTVALLMLGTAGFAAEAWHIQISLKSTANGVAYDGTCDASDLAIDVVYQLAMLVTDALLVCACVTWNICPAEAEGRDAALPDICRHTEAAYLDCCTNPAVHRLVQCVNVPDQPAQMLESSPFVTALSVLADVTCANTLGLPAAVSNIRVITAAWLICTVAFNVLVTLIIVIHLWPAKHLVQYGRAASAIGIIAESAAGYAGVGLLLIISILLESDSALFFVRAFGVAGVCVSVPVLPPSSLTPMQFLSASVITFRIAIGIGYTPPGSSDAASILPTFSEHWSSPITEDILKTR